MNIAVILAGGIGSRFGSSLPKQFLKIKNRTVLEICVEAFQKNSGIDEIAIVMNEAYIETTKKMAKDLQWSKVTKILSGGKERYESSVNAIKAFAEKPEIDAANFLIHDAARPLVTQRIINDTIAALEKNSAIMVAIPTTDTILELSSDKASIKNIPDRSFLYRCQTPQAFKYTLIKNAYELALADESIQATDDCGIVRKYLPDVKIHVVLGEERNMKLTYPDDIKIMEVLL
ncbi:MAG: 2-C-methyl-D-erythritol 4-phosphate cytidylyltransferase [Phascolarctobacterium sp.]|nr:2-C-methyl-D-erythritol 4-phosphate cytidylyltransferase [Phascolarctobacterium sp.]